MSIAYLDPGNIESDLQAGAVAEYRVRVSWLFTCIFVVTFAATVGVDVVYLYGSHTTGRLQIVLLLNIAAS